MASCEIQVVNHSVLHRIESFMGDASYREAIENSANYNTRLCVERRLRLPFLDSQTGVAQNHSNLFMTSRERIPGLLYGQVYTYPSKRWRKKRRQYLMQPQVGLRRCEIPSESGDLHTISTVENPAAMSEDSKDSAGVKDEAKSSDAWYYDEFELHSMEGFDDQDPDSDYDYEETYSKRKKKTRGGKAGGPGRGGSTPNDSPHTKKTGKGTGQGRGRKKGVNYAEIADSEKPFSCDLCGARYKTRPGLTYHYTHSHKDGTVSTPTTRSSSSNHSGNSSIGSGHGGPVGPPPPPPPQPTIDEDQTDSLAPPSPLIPPPQLQPQPPVQQQGWTNFAQDNYLTYLNAPGPARRGRPSAASTQHSMPQPPQDDLQSGAQLQQHKDKLPDNLPEPVLIMEQNEKARANPSPYCDFCLGDAVINKKSGVPEELVSCSDCGRSGHPTCLLFTDNMIISVRKYRWQCIECKCCSICGTSDNDDQLLFCDDCDRGYHMYCLIPPLHTPPEGSWSCRSCIRDFH